MLARFTKTVARLIDAGFTLKAALAIAGDTLSPQYKKVLTVIGDDKLERGITFSQALGEYPKYFPKILVSVIATGERSGQLSPVLIQMSEFYEEEVVYSLELFLTLIEPIMLVIVGLIVALMASSLISPLYRLISKANFAK
jgi:type II secretory pathway component PulF